MNHSPCSVLTHFKLLVDSKTKASVNIHVNICIVLLPSRFYKVPFGQAQQTKHEDLRKTEE